MENQTKEVCSGRVIYDNWGHSGHCQHKVTAHEDGKPWCTIHAPSYRARKQAEQQAQYDAQDARIHRDKARLALFDELVAVAKAQHGAIDTLMARLIGLDAQFRPSKSGEPWQALLLGNAVLVKAEAIEKEAKG